MQSQSTTFTCLVCSSPFVRFPSQVADGRTRFCSRQCSGAHRANEPLSERVARFTQQTETHWFWTGQRDDKGYGKLRVNSSPMLATHAAWEVTTGHRVGPHYIEIVGHVCDTPACVRVDDEGIYTIRGIDWPRRGHLFLATQSANIQDAYDKGRMQAASVAHPESVPYGIAHHAAKLNPDIIRWMRARYAEGGITYRQLGASVGISTMQARDIVLRKAWRHVL